MKRWIVIAGGFALAAFCASVVTAAAVHYPGRPNPANTATFFVVALVIVLILRFVFLLFGFMSANERHPLRAWWRAIWDAVPAYGATVTGAACICVFLVTVSWLKAMLPFVIPFWADASLSGIDQAIFGGHPKIPALLLFTVPYALWQGAHLGTILWVLHWRDGLAKDRAVLSFVLTWAIGMTAAYCFSSAGPIFTGHAVSDRLTMIEARYLWSNYKSAGAAIGGGISAFPSMHVAIACWVAFILWLRGFRWMGLVFVVLISLGAIALGWHYSADIPGGIAVAAVAVSLSLRLGGATTFSGKLS
jgi:hypothetical protein